MRNIAEMEVNKMRIEKVNVAWPNESPIFVYDLVEDNGEFLSRYPTYEQAYFWLKV